MRLTMVVREANRAAAQAAAATLNQGQPFNPALCNAGDPNQAITARWCSWEMSQGERDNLLSAFRAQGFNAREATIIDATRTVRTSDRLFVFDGGHYSPETILGVLSLQVRSVEEG